MLRHCANSKENTNYQPVRRSHPGRSLLVGALAFLCASGVGAGEPFVAEPLSQEVIARIIGGSLPSDTTLMPPSHLRYIPILHFDADGNELHGEIIVNNLIAEQTARIFKRLHEMRYPIQSVRLIDDFGCDDEASMRANNSSAFCYRRVKGSKKLSKHSLGLAIDINPLYNPYLKIVRNARGDSIGFKALQPSTATRYADRSDTFAMKITGPDDPIVRLFREEGFKWGGQWRNVKDYQHFEYQHAK